MKNLSLIFCFVLAVACSDDDASGDIDRTLLLAGEVSKNWRLAGESSDVSETVPSCRSTSDRAQDNTYTYFANGNMEWDNGEITEGPEENSCGDFRNLVGEWRFINDQATIVWTLERDRDDPSIIIDQTDTLNIFLLESDTLVLGDESEWLSFVPK